MSGFLLRVVIVRVPHKWWDLLYGGLSGDPGSIAVDRFSMDFRDKSSCLAIPDDSGVLGGAGDGYPWQLEGTDTLDKFHDHAQVSV